MAASLEPDGVGGFDVSFQKLGDVHNAAPVEVGASGVIYHFRWVGPEAASVVEAENRGAIFEGEGIQAGADRLEYSFPSDDGNQLYIARGSFETWLWPTGGLSDCVGVAHKEELLRADVVGAIEVEVGRD